MTRRYLTRSAMLTDELLTTGKHRIPNLERRPVRRMNNQPPHPLLRLVLWGAALTFGLVLILACFSLIMVLAF